MTDNIIDGSPKFKVPTYEGEDYTTSAVYDALFAMHEEIGTHGSLDGEDPIGDNIKRATFAAEAVRAYAEQTGVFEGETFFLAVADLMNDLRHLLDFVALADDSDAADGYPADLESLAGNDMHYQAEIRGEF